MRPATNIPRGRSRARVLALQALCVHEAVGERFAEELTAFLHDPKTYADLGLHRAPSADVLTFARWLVEGTWRERQRCDEILSEIAIEWSLTRMPPVDRNLLRLGVFELLEESATPAEVIIDEAIELARIFAAEESPGFINGVLDKARQRLGVPLGIVAGRHRSTDTDDSTGPPT